VKIKHNKGTVMPNIRSYLTAKLVGREFSAWRYGRFAQGNEFQVHVWYTARWIAELVDLVTKRLGNRTSVSLFVGSHLIDLCLLIRLPFCMHSSSSWMALQPLRALVSFQFPDQFTISRTLWTNDHLVARPLPQHRTVQTQEDIYTHQTSMP
jgi:hypothetical protein